MDTIHAGTLSGPAVPAFDSPPDPVSGPELAHARLAARLPRHVIASGMGVCESRLRALEALTRTTPEVQKRYLDSLSAAIAEREAQR
jgi:hypothetical protein